MYYQTEGFLSYLKFNIKSKRYGDTKKKLFYSKSTPVVAGLLQQQCYYTFDRTVERVWHNLL